MLPFRLLAVVTASALLSLCSSGASWGASYSTTFPVAENPLQEGGAWMGGKSAGLAWTDFQSVGNFAFGLQPGTSQSVYDDSIALLAGTWGPDQTVQATVRTLNQNDSIFEELEIRLRSTLSPNSSTGYECNFSARSSANAYVQVVRWNGPLGDFTLLDSRGGTAMALRDGDTIACSISGKVITAYINGVQKLQVSDSTFSGGNPGIGAFLQNGSGVNRDYGFTSVTATDGGQATPPPAGSGSISLSASSYTVNEPAGSVQISAVRSGGSAGAVGISYSTSAGSALPDQDYTTTIGNLSWAAGDTAAKTFSVPILVDGTAEPNEAFTVNLASPTGGATLGTPSTATVTIVDGSAITIGQKNVLGSQGRGDANTLQGIKASLGQAATLTSLSIYFKAAAGSARLSIYDDKGNYPGALRAQTAAFTPVAGWNTQNVQSPVVLAPGNYWLMWQTNSNSAGVAYAPGASPYVVAGYAFGAPPAAFPSGASPSPDESLYATLTVGGAANAAPTVATAARADPSPVAGRTATLSVLGADDGGEAGLTYTWATTGSPPAPVTFSANGTNAAKSVVATFTKVGTYAFQVTIRDGGNLTATSAVTVTVTPTTSTIMVTPASASVSTGATQAFAAAAADQFGAPLAAQPAFGWTVSGGGTVNAAGVFTAGSSAGGPYVVDASSAGVHGTASVMVTASAPAPFTVGSTAVLSSTSSNDAGVLLAYKVSLPRAATIQSLSIYTKKSGGTLYLAIYDDNGGYPGALKASTAAFSPSTGWNTRDVTSKVSLPAGTYWLVYEPSSNSYGTGYDAGGSAKSSYEAAGSFGAMPSTYRSGARANSYRFSLYASFL